MSASSPTTGSWYRLPDGDTFRVITIDEQDDYIEIQYSDGTSEALDEDLWQRLGASEFESDADLESALEREVEELDFMALGVAPGAEVPPSAHAGDQYGDYDY